MSQNPVFHTCLLISNPKCLLCVTKNQRSLNAFLPECLEKCWISAGTLETYSSEHQLSAFCTVFLCFHWVQSSLRAHHYLTHVPPSFKRSSGSFEGLLLIWPHMWLTLFFHIVCFLFARPTEKDFFFVTIFLPVPRLFQLSQSSQLFVVKVNV